MKIQDEKDVDKLVKALKNGAPTAFDELFSIYGNRLYGFVFGYLKMKEEAEEIVQEVFLTVWRTRKNLKPELSFKAYLFKIAYHQILEHFERTTKQQEYKHHIIDEAVDFTNDVDERLNYQMLLDKVETVINQLPPRQKEILIKKKKEGLSLKEIARQLKISPKTVENHLSEALKNIKKELGIENISAILLFILN
ncbi:RNA polymerase sigma factor [Maribellus comscasis]|uniref:RNA polymerase sigma factor n=1 Tax=Maribellus comscasis TaxID=2681766 RepID=UPI00131D9B83|nr:RNA polymerase sigma-70 factor [Maribellus comscasis]